MHMQCIIVHKPLDILDQCLQCRRVTLSFIFFKSINLLFTKTDNDIVIGICYSRDQHDERA